MTLVTQAVFSRMCRTSRKTVTKWKQEDRLVMKDQLIDVEATTERMAQTSRRGSPIVLTPEEAARPFAGERAATGSVPRVVTRTRASKPVSMLCTDIVAELEELDWGQSFDWTPAAQAERVRKAAECIGWQAVETDLRDDGHWGGFQLRNPALNGPNGLTEDTIVAGFGFELTPDDVLREIRYQVEPIDDDDRETVRPDLLPLLAHPWRANERPD
ncbi:MAG: hypothetical protein ACTHJG_02105 [Rhodanobacteraceae bacterium]